MAGKNPHGDLVLTDRAVIRLVAEPTGYAVLTRLQRHGRATVGELAHDLHLEPAAVADTLEGLAGHELVRPVGDAWEALGTGLLVELPDDAEGQEAARLLTTRMFLEAAARPEAWWADDEPRLPADWRQVAGLINAGLWLTPDEVQGSTTGSRSSPRPMRSAPRPTRPEMPGGSGSSATSCPSPAELADQPAGFSRCPPNWWRIAERTRCANSPSARDEKRS